MPERINHLIPCLRADGRTAIFRNIVDQPRTKPYRHHSTGSSPRPLPHPLPLCHQRPTSLTPTPNFRPPHSTLTVSTRENLRRLHSSSPRTSSKPRLHRQTPILVVTQLTCPHPKLRTQTHQPMLATIAPRSACNHGDGSGTAMRPVLHRTTTITRVHDTPLHHDIRPVPQTPDSSANFAGHANCLLICIPIRQHSRDRDACSTHVRHTRYDPGSNRVPSRPSSDHRKVFGNGLSWRRRNLQSADSTDQSNERGNPALVVPRDESAIEPRPNCFPQSPEVPVVTPSTAAYKTIDTRTVLTSTACRPPRRRKHPDRQINRHSYHVHIYEPLERNHSITRRPSLPHRSPTKVRNFQLYNVRP